MKLSAEQFAEITASFGGQQAARTHDRRRAARLELQANVKITQIVSGQSHDPIFVTISDFSARGIGFIHCAEMTPGQQFVIELPRRTGGRVELLCTVIHCREVAPRTFCIGAEFIRVLSNGTARQYEPSSGQRHSTCEAPVG